jgi:hypothetical protein
LKNEQVIVKHVDMKNFTSAYFRYNPWYGVEGYLRIPFLSNILNYFSLYHHGQSVTEVTKPQESDEKKLFDAAKQFYEATNSYKLNPNKQNASDCLLLIKAVIFYKKKGVGVGCEFNKKTAQEYLIESGYVECEIDEYKSSASFKIKGTTLSEWRSYLQQEDKPIHNVVIGDVDHHHAGD